MFKTYNLKGNSWSQVNLHLPDNVTGGQERASKIQAQRCRRCGGTNGCKYLGARKNKYFEGQSGENYKFY